MRETHALISKELQYEEKHYLNEYRMAAAAVFPQLPGHEEIDQEGDGP